MTAADLRLYVDAAREAALAGAREILEVYGQPFDVYTKEDASPVTEADRRSQAAILAVLGRRCPGIPAMSEEAVQADYALRSGWPVYWLIDPLDGTKEFVARRGEFTVNVALVEGRYPVMGLVYTPTDGVCYIGSPDGAYRTGGGRGAEGDPVRLPVRDGDADHVRAAVSRSHLDERTRTYLAALEARGRPVRSVQAGSARKLCLVAEGTADVYPRFGTTMEWDTAAGQAVVEAAGGLLVDAQTGHRLSCNKPDLRNPGFVALAPGRDPGYFLSDLPNRPDRGSGI